MEYNMYFTRCVNCRNYRSLYYFDDNCWQKAGGAVCRRNYNIDEMDNKGCFKFEPKGEDYELLENKQIDTMDIILVLKKQLENLKILIKIFEDNFYGKKK